MFNENNESKVVKWEGEESFEPQWWHSFLSLNIAVFIPSSKNNNHKNQNQIK